MRMLFKMFKCLISTRDERIGYVFVNDQQRHFTVLYRIYRIRHTVFAKTL